MKDQFCDKERLRPIEIADYNPDWPALYKSEATCLEALIQDNLVAPHHIGSTAVPELAAKPVVDILLVVKSLTALDKANASLQAYGYHAMGEYGSAGRRYFWKTGHAFHLHVFEEGHPEIDKYLKLRNYLIANPGAAEHYAQAKRTAAQAHPMDRHAYSAAKSLTITGLLEAAERWTEKGPRADTVFPLPIVGRNICYLKNVVTNPNVMIGDYTYYHDRHDAHNFEKNNIIYHEPIIKDRLIIGKFCQIAMGTRFIMNASTHQMTGFSTYPFAVFNEHWAKSYPVDFPLKGDTIVGNDVWFGYQSLIMPGIKIGDGAIIATHSLVTKDVPPYTIVGGNPAKIIRQRFSDQVIAELLAIRWWDWPIEQILANLPAITGADISALKAASHPTE